MVKCEECGKKLEGEIIKLQDPYSDAVYHYFCSEDCLKEWLFEDAFWEYIDAKDIGDLLSKRRF